MMNTSLQAPLAITATPSRGLVIRQGDKVAQWTDRDAIWQAMQWGVAGFPIGGFHLTQRQKCILAKEAGTLLLEMARPHAETQGL